MKRELIIALAVSLALHGGIVLAGQFFKEAPVREKPPEDIPTIELMALPPVDPEVVEPLDAPAESTADLADLAPPMQNDLPSAVLDSPFIQQVQPPPPPGLTRATGTLSIPVGRPTGGVGAGMKTVFDLASLDQKPIPTFQAKPVYPFELKRAGITGTVTLGFIITSAGTVRDPYIISSSNREFEDAAMQGVLKWKFRPGKKSGAAVDARATITIPFTIGEN